jgi:predicted metal-dependent phosphoesterase TrpH
VWRRSEEVVHLNEEQLKGEMNSLRLKIDLHTHTDFDPADAIDYSAQQLIDEAARQGFDVLSITCHNALQWTQSLSEYAASTGILLIPGVEATLDGKHILIYGLEHFRPPMNFTQLRALRQAHPEVLTIAPHPFFPGSTSLGERLFQYEDCFDAIEYSHFYTREMNFNQKGVEAARAQDKPLVGSSDVHLLRQLGRTYSYVKVEDKSIESVVAAIKSGSVDVATVPLTRKELVSIGLQMEAMSLRSTLRRFGLLTRKPKSVISSAPD